MTTITILPESNSPENPSFLAISGTLSSTGKTAGEALDALSVQLEDENGDTLVILHRGCADEFFSAEQRSRLDDLMGKWRAARDAGSTLAPDEMVELEALVQAELKASEKRARALIEKVSQ
jgi:hypothetical protein